MNVLRIKTSRGSPAGSAMPRIPHLFPQRFTAASKRVRVKRKSDEDKNSGISQQFGAVIEDVVAHLVRHHHANFRERALLEKIIVQRNPRCPEES